MSRGPARFVLACALTSPLLGFASAGCTLPPPRRPKLVVLLSVDQMRADYVERYRHQWSGGLKRLAESGAWFRNAAYPYMNTVTCPGHATIATGALPSVHGMVLNQWWDRAAGRPVFCTTDESVTNVAFPSGAKGHESAARLLATTLSDEMRVQMSPRPRVVSLSLKPRSALSLGGHRADFVMWFGAELGWFTSTTLGQEAQAFLSAAVSERAVEQDLGATWTRSLSDSEYLYADDGLGEGKEGWGRTFPHVVRGRSDKPDAVFYALWQASPFADEYLGRLATTALREFQLGRDDRTDYLAVSFSALDGVGHAFGPRSHEVQDTLVRLDATLGRLLGALDVQVGPGEYVVALTGDHGVAPIPEQMKELGIDAGRVAIDIGESSPVNAAVARHLGPGQYVEAILYTDLYFAPGVFERLVATDGALREVTDVLERSPGVLRVYRRDEILAARLPAGDDLARAVALSFLPDRSGDLILVPRPYWINEANGTTHGTGYRYDARVPILLAGYGIRPGHYDAPASPADVAPTLAYLVGVTLPHPWGRVLREAVAIR
jgi:predicted AlkP superfamily pyrophosphatase or phosphodiesterase